MKITKILWKSAFIEKIERKHHVLDSEIEEILKGKKKVKRIARGNVKGEDVYLAMGKTEAGRYLSIFFILKKDGSILPISAREMDAKEKKRYKHGK
ncbi:MAG: BrnT family toxin [Deltaproteobacteria bacterium]|nr:BrnT family toxin [Deltaproteobacteria bacterium]MBW1737427.1 BrnT family toxin [Deltaproteobacteria bacterium]MBW1910558.1 BrnT family toxin [Deltaproteobacteria bacterium]MBW2034594.1 BrnT family toxin [Deltaproteobacteria bacterium]MBW2114968.1 BrnT family toxin [Deltaproteobacteria bacterium]